MPLPGTPKARSPHLPQTPAPVGGSRGPHRDPGRRGVSGISTHPGRPIRAGPPTGRETRARQVRKPSLMDEQCPATQRTRSPVTSRAPAGICGTPGQRSAPWVTGRPGGPAPLPAFRDCPPPPSRPSWLFSFGAGLGRLGRHSPRRQAAPPAACWVCCGHGGRPPPPQSGRGPHGWREKTDRAPAGSPHPRPASRGIANLASPKADSPPPQTSPSTAGKAPGRLLFQAQVPGHCHPQAVTRNHRGQPLPSSLTPTATLAPRQPDTQRYPNTHGHRLSPA